MSAKDLLSAELTDVQKRFVMSFVLDFNIKSTSKRTGISTYMCRQLVKEPIVEQALDMLRGQIAEICDLTQAEVLNEIKRVAFYDVKDHIKSMDKYGMEPNDFEDIDGRAIAEVTVCSTSDGRTFTNIKAHSKMKALEILANWFKGVPEEKHVHFHMEDDANKRKTAAECATDYVNLLNGGVK